MAEIAIPILGLGARYVLSNRDDEKEGYTPARRPPEQGQIKNTLPMGGIKTGAPMNPAIKRFQISFFI